MDKFRKRLGTRISSTSNVQLAPPDVQLVSSFGYTSNFVGRLGNHMFIYAYVRLLAEHEGRPWRLYSDLLKRFNTQNESSIRTTVYNRPAGTEWYQDNENLDLLLKHRDEIRSWFKLSNIGKEFLEKRGFPTVVHVRGTDFVDIGRSLSRKYYEKVMKANEKYLIVTDDIDYAKQLLPGYDVVSSRDDLSILGHCRSIIASHSTYCWWGIFLGGDKSVIAPTTDWTDIGDYLKRYSFQATQWGIRNLGWSPVYG